MWLDYSRTWSLLVALSLAAIADAGNYGDTRGGSGQREFICREEGYHADPQNCMIYYRCVLFGDGRPLTKYSFECGPGTVFSPLKGNVCTHPYESGRKECDGTKDDSNKINDIDSNNINEPGMVRPGTHGKPESQSPQPPPPPTCPVCGPSSVPGSTGTTAAVTPSSVRPNAGAGGTAGWETSTERITQAPNKPNIGIKCTAAGFMADPHDCTKFYRCVDEGNGSYKRYDFTCGIGTIWDPKIDTCNHPWDVNRAGCNAPTDPNPLNEPSKESGSSTTTIGVTPSSVRPGQGISSTSGSLSNTENVTRPPIPSPSGTVCTCQGFMGDPYDCKVFYRCLDAGNGKFTRQVFTCGIGSIWHPQISACDDPARTNRPECKVPTDSDSSQKPSYLPSSTTAAGQTSSSMRPTQDNSNTGSSISTTESINQGSDGSSKPSQIPGSVTSGVTQSTVSPSREDSITGGSISTTESIDQVSNAPTSGPQCTCAGFMADPKDCKKFYRCVDEGNGLYRRYEFGCGIGTAWDQELQTCNYPWAVNRDLCKIPAESNTSNGPSLPGSTETTTSVTATSVTPTQGDSGTGGSITSTESMTQVPNEGSSGLPPSESSSAVPPSGGASEVPPLGGSSEVPPSGGSSETTPLDGSSGLPPLESSPAVPPSEGASEVPPSESSSQVPPLEGSSEIPPTESSSNAPPSESSTDFPSSESPTQAPISEGSPDTPPSQVTSEAPSSGGASEVPTSDGSSEVPPSQSSSESPSSQATSQTPSSEVSSELAPSGSSLSPGQGAPGVSPTTVPSTTDGSLGGPTAGDTAGNQCNKVEQNCGNRPAGGSDSRCMDEGFFANDNDCTKFYRCVSTGPGTYTKYEFACGSGTAWDQVLLTCNYIHQVSACNKSGNNKPSGGATSGKPADITSPPDSSTESSSSSTSSSPQSSTEAPISEGSTDTPPSQVTSEAPSSGGASEVPTSDGSSEVPPSQSSSESPSSQATSQTPSSEVSSELAPSGSSLSPGQGAPGVSPTTVPSTTDGSLGGPTAGDTAGNQCNEVEQNCGNRPAGGSDSRCMDEGFFTNDDDCTKFYRCVSTGPGTYTKYEFACGSGTAWDQVLLTCNHIHQVSACNKSGNNKPSGGVTPGKPADITSPPDSSTESSSSSTSSSEESTSSSSSSESTSSTSLSESTSSSSSESTSEQSSENTSTSKPCDNNPAPPINSGIVCNKEGFYSHPRYCNKFYRCVDNGNGFNVYHFDCPPGTIYDPSISVCNYPSSVYPPRNCEVGPNSGETTGPSGTSEKPESSTTGATVTPAKPEGESTEAPSGSTPEGDVSSSSEATTASSAEASTDTSQDSTSQEEQTSGSTTDISAETSTEVSQSTTSQEELTTMETATEQSQNTTPVEQSSTEESPSSTEDGAESAATTTSSAEETTNDMIQSTTSQEEQSSTIESGSSTESETSDAPTSTNEPTTSAEQQSTESQEATTVAEQQSTDSVTQTAPSEPAGTVTCPIGNLTGEQIVLVCPTGFKQHPKYCNMFYQCTMDSAMDVKILTFHCPDDTIFDDKKIQCLSEKKASQPCKGVKAGARVYRRVEAAATTLINIEQRETLCPSEGYYPHNGQECSNVFYKCKKDSRGALQGYLYECPENFVFWTVSRRCERASSLPMCSGKYSASKNDNDFRESRYQLPVEDSNRSARMTGHH